MKILNSSEKEIIVNLLNEIFKLQSYDLTFKEYPKDENYKDYLWHIDNLDKKILITFQVSNSLKNKPYFILESEEYHNSDVEIFPYPLNIEELLKIIEILEIIKD